MVDAPAPAAPLQPIRVHARGVAAIKNPNRELKFHGQQEPKYEKKERDQK
jgi:hypothetical protein